MKLTTAQREAIRLKFGGRCAYCGCVLLEKKWHADHVEPVMRQSVWFKGKPGRPGRFATIDVMDKPENDRLSNIVPACIPCNVDKGAVPLEAWRNWLNERIVEGLRRNSSTFRHAERFGRVIIVGERVTFWFEKFQASSQAKAS